ncbi:hypothetical protein P9112_011276 [Eukaryota sp. TZLM1-RC]
MCYTGKITHVVRSCAPSIALDFRQSFNSLRTEFFVDLLAVDQEMLQNHLFSVAKFGGVGLTKSSILCQSAFVAEAKNFIFEFSRRFPESHLLDPNTRPYLNDFSSKLHSFHPKSGLIVFPNQLRKSRSDLFLIYCFVVKYFSKNCRSFLKA